MRPDLGSVEKRKEKQRRRIVADSGAILKSVHSGMKTEGGEKLHVLRCYCVSRQNATTGMGVAPLRISPLAAGLQLAPLAQQEPAAADERGEHQQPAAIAGEGAGRAVVL
jgi:hypothetical protein